MNDGGIVMYRLGKQGLVLFFDALLANAAVIISLFMYFEAFLISDWARYWAIMIPITAVWLLSNYFFGLYRRAWRYASIDEVVAIVSSATVGCIANVLILRLAFDLLPPRGLLALVWCLQIFFFGGTRFAWRVFYSRPTSLPNGEPAKRVLIVGAGDGGVLVAREFRNHYANDFRVVGFVDDDPVKQNKHVFGYPVLGGTEQISTLVETHQVDEIVISMPSVDRKTIRRIVELSQPTGKKIKILPGVYDLIDGNVTVQNIREIELQDLLGRDPVKADLEGISAYLTDRVVLVTGGGGSIGSELCRQVVDFKPRLLLIMDNCENSVYDIELELAECSDVKVIPLVKDIRDQSAVDKVFAEYQPNVVFHAAAHKHVPLMEANPEEAIKTNVYGTYSVAWAAHRYGADRFVLVSTDTAVNPTSVMGASIRIAEMIIQHLDTISSTNYPAVRFGNVLGSRGSVMPLFRKQILAGGPVTVTHKDMIRYFMTIPEAVQLIIQAGALAGGGEVFVLDMGEQVRIMDLAETLIRLSGLKPYVDIDIKVTGMRPGEKLYEELFTPEEGVDATKHQRIFVAKPCHLDLPLLEATVAALESNPGEVLPGDPESTLEFIQRFLPCFRADEDSRAGWLEAAAAKAE